MPMYKVFWPDQTVSIGYARSHEDMIYILDEIGDASWDDVKVERLKADFFITLTQREELPTETQEVADYLNCIEEGIGPFFELQVEDKSGPMSEQANEEISEFIKKNRKQAQWSAVRKKLRLKRIAKAAYLREQKE